MKLKMLLNLLMAATLAFAVGAVIAYCGRAQSASAASLFPADNGPASIDVSKYPEAQQKNYRLFLKKCSMCHTTARAVNAPYVLPKEWNDCVARMVRMPGAGINASMAKRIASFLAYDSSVRKADLLKKKESSAASASKASR